MEELTMEQLQQMVTDLQTQADELTAERDSLREELTQLQESSASMKSELAETKKLNYTLGRRLDVGGKKESAEDVLAAMLKEM